MDALPSLVFCVYTFSDPVAPEEIRYVGISSTPQKRLREHLAEARRGVASNYKNVWLRSLLSAGRTPTFNLLFEGLSLERACEIEIDQIQIYRDKGHRLTNTSSGGQGALGVPISDALREKLKGNDYAKGNKFTPEARARLSESRKGNTNRRGKPSSLETKEKQRQAHLGKKHTEETKEKQRQARLRFNALQKEVNER